MYFVIRIFGIKKSCTEVSSYSYLYNLKSLGLLIKNIHLVLPLKNDYIN